MCTREVLVCVRSKFMGYYLCTGKVMLYMYRSRDGVLFWVGVLVCVLQRGWVSNVAKSVGTR